MQLSVKGSVDEHPYDPAFEKKRRRSFIAAIPFGLLGFFGHIPFWAHNDAHGVESWMASLGFFPLAVILSMLGRDSSVRGRQIHEAWVKLGVAHDSIGYVLAKLRSEDEEKGKPCWDAYTKLLRSLYALAAERPLQVVSSDGRASSQYDVLLAAFLDECDKAGIEGKIRANNGPLYKWEEARFTIREGVRSPIPLGTYLVNACFLVSTYILISLVLSGKELEWWLGASIVGFILGYTCPMLIIIAKQRRYPIGRGPGYTDAASRFLQLEHKSDLKLRELRARVGKTAEGAAAEAKI